jgi:ACT domain-containing protein
MDDLERLTRFVVRAVGERLGSQSPDVVELVVREVVGAMSGASGVPAPSTPAPPDRPEGDTVTTALGAVLPRPTNHEQPSLELCASCLELHRRQHQNRAVVTTTGRNARGVVATMARQVAEAGGDIQDISQTIISEYFTMIMVVDIEQLTVPFSDFKERVVSAASDLGIHAVVMHEDVMRSLQRV